MAQLLVGKPVGDAMNRAEGMLFKPFARKKWMALGVAAWLAAINEWNGVGGAFELIPHFGWKILNDPDGFARWMELNQARMFVWMGVAAVLLFGVYLLVRWLNCRGQFMLLDAVVNDRLAAKESWRTHRELANSLLKFRIGWDLIVFNIFLAIFVVVGVLLWMDFRVMLRGEDYAVTAWTWSAIVLGGLATLAAMVIVGLAMFFIDYVVVPVMYVRKLHAKPALRIAWRELFKPHKKKVLQYLLLLVGIESIHSMAMSAGTLALALGTCLIGLAMKLIPLISLLPLYVAATIALPVAVFSRSYCLYFLQQFGEEYRPNWKECQTSNTTQSTGTHDMVANPV
jgi:hypothetical protein